MRTQYPTPPSLTLFVRSHLPPTSVLACTRLFMYHNIPVQLSHGSVSQFVPSCYFSKIHSPAFRQQTLVRGARRLQDRYARLSVTCLRMCVQPTKRRKGSTPTFQRYPTPLLPKFSSATRVLNRKKRSHPFDASQERVCSAAAMKNGQPPLAMMLPYMQHVPQQWREHSYPRRLSLPAVSPLEKSTQSSTGVPGFNGKLVGFAGLEGFEGEPSTRVTRTSPPLDTRRRRRTAARL